MVTPEQFAVIEPLLVVWLGLLGLVIGSFLNVVIARVPLEQSVVKPRSRCPRCGYTLAWFDNVPVLSWLWLRGRCRQCKLPIPIRYPLVELLTALLFVACWRRFGWDYPLAPALMLVTLLVPLAFIDADHWILPFELTLPGIALGVLMSLPLGKERLLASVLGALIGFVLLRAMEFFGWLAFRKEALGAGDKFLVALLGAFLTFRGLFGVVFLAALQGSVFGVARIFLTGRAGPPVSEPAETLDPAPPTMTWAFLKPGLSRLQRLLAIPYALFLQPIPDDPVDVTGEEVEWTPGPGNLPFGPWLALAGLELMLLSPWFAGLLPLEGIRILFELG